MVVADEMEAPGDTPGCTAATPPDFQIYQVSGPKGFVAETRDAHTGNRDAQAFMFTAVGTTDD